MRFSDQVKIIMDQRCLLVTFLISPALSQYVMEPGARADMIFGDQNERFDVGSIIAEQNRMYNDEPEYQRTINDEIPLIEAVKGELLRRRLANMKRRSRHLDTSQNRSLRRIGDFAYHDSMKGDDYDDFERNLEIFLDSNRRKEAAYNFKGTNKRRSLADSLEDKEVAFRTNRIFPRNMVDYLEAGNKKHTRRSGRSMNTENEVLLHHAVPINLKVNGYIQVPLES